MIKHTASGYPLQDYYSGIYKTYDLVNRLFTLGQDRKWRRRTVKICLLDNPQRILDLCCGTGDLALELAVAGDRQPEITGYDQNKQMLEMARNKASRLQIQSVSFIQGDAVSMPFADHEFDRITIGFGFRNLTWENPQREKYLTEISRVMKPGARLLILESAVPENQLIRIFYQLYLWLILIPLGGFLSGNWKAYRYLAGSSSDFYNFNTLKTMLHQYHLNLKTGEKYLFGSVNLLIATKIGT
jgi:demethylmenaquinone methyltransferase / 2-methoxy-6-polyprenyl-1,4-benzoquinol methylase